MQYATVVLSALFAAGPPPFMTEPPSWPSSFHEYCDAIGLQLKDSSERLPVDPTDLPAGSKFFTLPVMEELLGKRIPSGSRSLGEGTLWLGFVVNLNHRVSFVQVLEGTNPRLNYLAINTLERSKFTPAWLDGEFVPSCMAMKVNFSD